MRVIAGTLKGRTLKAPKGSRTRPTADRVKEALFSILGPMEGFNVLDLYAGTGALGIEALSRGARCAVFVESSHESGKCLRDNLVGLKIEESTRVILLPVERAQNEIAKHAPFDLIMCDPPWSQVEIVWTMLAKSRVHQHLVPNGTLVLEHPVEVSVNLATWREFSLVLTRAWGDSAVSILQNQCPVHEP